MVTPIESLEDALKQRKAQGIKVASIDFVLNEIARHREYYDGASIKPKEPLKIVPLV